MTHTADGAKERVVVAGLHVHARCVGHAQEGHPRILGGALGLGTFMFPKELPNSSVWYHMGGCQNYGPFLDPYYNTHPIFRVPKKGPYF